MLTSSIYTLLQRKNLSTFTKPLSNYRIPYKWGHHVKLIVTKDGKTYTIRSLEEGLNRLRDWQILDRSECPSKQHRTPKYLDPEWNVVGSIEKIIT